MLAALAGGVGAARSSPASCARCRPSEIVAIVNTADDDEFHGLYVSPDLDSVTYTLAGASNTAQGWGLEGETFATPRRAAALRGRRLVPARRQGPRHPPLPHRAAARRARTLSEVTAEIARAWELEVRLLPMTDDPVRTRITVREPRRRGARARDAGVVRARAGRARGRTACDFAGADAATPAPGVLDALRTADTVLVCPSNPVISIGPILAVPGIRDALRARRDRVVAVSPIVGGAPVKGPADRLMGPLGIEVSCVGVARAYAEFCGTLVIDAVDADLAPAVEAAGVHAVVADTMMRSPEIAAELARHALAAVA